MNAGPHLTSPSGRGILSGGFAVVISQDAAQPLATLDLTGSLTNLRARLDQLVVQPLVVSLGVVVLQVLADRPAQRPIAKEDDARKRFARCASAVESGFPA